MYILLYSRKIWRFGGLYYMYNRQIKIRQNFLLAYIHMATLYRTTKFKSTNILAIAILSSNAKFDSHQYFRLYGYRINVNLQADGKSKVIHVDDFTEDLFSKMLDQLLNNRDKDMDVVFSNL